MARTQRYLKPQEREGLAALSQATGRKQSDLMREAVDRMIEQSSAQRNSHVAGLQEKSQRLGTSARLMLDSTSDWKMSPRNLTQSLYHSMTQ